MCVVLLLRAPDLIRIEVPWLRGVGCGLVALWPLLSSSLPLTSRTETLSKAQGKCELRSHILRK